MRLKSVSIILFCLFVILLSSCSQYRFVKAKPAKQNVEQSANAEKQNKARQIETSPNVEAIMPVVENYVIESSNELPIEHIEHNGVIQEYNNEIPITERNQSELVFQPNLPTVVDSPVVKKAPVIKTYKKDYTEKQKEWHDKAAKIGFIFALGHILIQLIAVGFIIFAILGSTPFGAAITVIIILASLAFLLLIFGFIFSIIGLKSENNYRFAKIGTIYFSVILGLALLPYVIGAIAAVI